MPTRRESNLYTAVPHHGRGVFDLAFSCSQEQFWVDTTGIARDNYSVTVLTLCVCSAYVYVGGQQLLIFFPHPLFHPWKEDSLHGFPISEVHHK